MEVQKTAADRRRIGQAVKVIAFLALLMILLVRFHQVFRFKYSDGIYGLEQFYKEPENSLDVLFFGSSHMYVNVNTSTLWKEYGMAGYDLGGSEQPIWNSYYYMKEALKTQRPAVLVLDCYTAGRTGDYVDESRIIKNTYGLKPSADKTEAVKVSAPEDAQTAYLLEYPTYHGRYTDLAPGDFNGYKETEFVHANAWKGEYLHTAVHGQSRLEVEGVTGAAALTEKNEMYLRKIIELAREEEIPLVLMAAPFVASEYDMQVFHRVEEIAGEYQVDFVDFNMFCDEMGLDFSTDFADNCHMNYGGSEKFTRYLAEYLKERYDLPDRRGDSAYQSYDVMVQYYDQYVANDMVRRTGELAEYLQRLQNPHYITVFFLKGDGQSAVYSEDVKQALAAFGIVLDEGGETDRPAAWVVQNGAVIFACGDCSGARWYQEVGQYDVLTVQAEEIKAQTEAAEDEASSLQVLLNASPCYAVRDGLNILTYDLLNESLVECAGFAVTDRELSMTKQ